MEHAKGDADDQAGKRQADDAHVVEGPNGVLLQIQCDEAAEQESGDGAQDGTSPPHARTPLPKATISSTNPVTAVPATATMPSGVVRGSP